MEYGKIVSVTGLPGLYELLNTKADGAIVRSLDDQATRFISSRVHNFSHLESIEVYTTADNVNLVEVFEAMSNSGEKLPDEKDASGVKKYFEKIYGSIDFDRVYNSDMKKMIKWYSILKANDVEIKLPEPEPEPEPEEVEVVEEVVAPKKEKKKEEKKAETPKKAEKVKEAAPAKEKEKPAKKAAKPAESKSASKPAKKEEAPKKAAKKTATKSAKKK